MRYPDLVPDSICKTDIEIIPYSDNLGEDGEPIILDTIKSKCNYQGSSKRILTAQKEEIQLSGIALMPGFVMNEKKGEVMVLGEKHEIVSVTPCLNPDGSINYTKIEVV